MSSFVPFLLDDDTSGDELDGIRPASVLSGERVPGPQPLVDPYALGPLRPAPVASGERVPGPRAPVHPALAVPIRPMAVPTGERVPGPWLPDLPDPSLPTIPAGPATVNAGVQVVGYPLATAVSVSPKLNDVGSAKFTVRPPGPDPDEVVGIKVAGRRVFSVLAGRLTEALVSAGEESDRLVDVDAPGLLDEWRDVLVLPDFGAQDVARLGHPTQDVRVFDWTMNGLGNASFGEYGATLVPSVSLDLIEAAITTRTFALPDSWPDPWARWMWVSDLRRAQPRGWCHFRVPTPLGPGPCRVWICAHDYAEVWIDGVPLLVADSPGVAQSIPVDLSGHHHLVTIKAYNRSGPAGVLFSIMPVNGRAGLYAPTALINSRSNWKAVAYPTRTFISTPGQVLRRLRLEANRRGAIPTGVGQWRFTFGDLLDSAGRPWPRVEPVTLDVGMTMLDVLMRLAEDRLDFAPGPGGRVLDAWVKGTVRGSGVDVPAPWTETVDLTSKARKVESR